MRNKIINFLFALGLFLLVVNFLALSYRAFMIKSINGSTILFIISMILNIFSLLLLLKSLVDSKKDADKNSKDKKLKSNFLILRKRIFSVLIAFLSSLYSIYSLGLSINEYLQWIWSPFS